MVVDDSQTSIPADPYSPTPNPSQIPNYMPNNNALAPVTRPDPNAPTLPSGQVPYARTPFPSAAGATGSSPAGVTITDGPGEKDGASAFQSVAKASLQAVGNSGTQIFGGYFSEEYLGELRGRQGAKKWDEMRRSEAQISMLLNAVTNPIKAANWDIEPYDQTDPDSVSDADLCKMIMFEMIDFNTFKHEALTMLPFGFSMFEIVHNVVFNDPKFGTFNGLKSLSFRSQKTIENWQLEQKTGRLIGVNQYTYSDLGGNEFIPGEFLLVFTHMKEGDNYEGISVLRSMLGAYKRKDLYLKLCAIGLEKYAVGIPIGSIPAGKERSLEAEEFKTVLASFTSHELAYMVKPAGWTIDIQKTDFDADKVKELIVLENTEMANALVANFLALGMNGGGGAYALGSNLGEFFTTGIQSYADLTCDGVNRTLLPNLVQLNKGKRRGYPKMKCTGISDKAGKELAETIKFLSDARVLDPDMPLKEFLRKQYKLPKVDVNTATAMPAIPAGAAANYPKPNDPVVNPKTGKVEPYQPSQLTMQEREDTLQLADAKYVKAFDKNKARLKALMQSNLKEMYSGLKAKLKTKYNGLPDSDKILCAKGVDTPGVVAYKSALVECLAQFAQQSIDAAKKQARVKLSESDQTIKLGAGFYNKLPPAIQKIVNIQASLVADTQVADMEKSVFFSFTTAAVKSDDIDNILNQVDESVEPMIEGSTAKGMSVDAGAGDALAHVAQQAALETFFAPDVLDTIESFTFTNEDPVSEICQSLAGTTFAPGDADLSTYQPPLHHNCKSRLVPNMKGDSGNPKIDRGGISVSQKALDSMTLCDHVQSWKMSEDSGRK